MSKRFCGQCGAENDGNGKFCIYCGAPLGEQQKQKRASSYDSFEQSFNRSSEWKNPREEEIIYTNIAPRSIALSVVLTIVTFGIYGVYWGYKLNNEVNELAQDPIAPGGGMVIFLCIVTLGFYGIYWHYKMGTKCDYIRQVNSYSGVLFMLLRIFGLGIVSYALIQDTINSVLE